MEVHGRCKELKSKRAHLLLYMPHSKTPPSGARNVQAWSDGALTAQLQVPKP